MVSDELGRQLAAKGFAVPGMEDVGREVRDQMTTRACTQAAPCEFDIFSAAASLFETVAAAVLFFLFLGQVVGSTLDEDALEAQAIKSRERRDRRMRDFGERLRPLQESPLGWRLVDSDGMPTGNALLFLFAAVTSQCLLAWLLATAFAL
ncbi:MAG: hypothetical protein SGPRY_012621 [Prymnesium sp.]